MLTRKVLLKRSIFPALVVTALVVVATRLLDMREIGAALLRARPWPLAALLACHLTSTLLHALRLRMLLRGSVSYALAFHANNICNLVNSVLPLRAGEFAMALIISRRTEAGGGEVLSNILVDRLLALISVFLVFLLALPFAGALSGSLPGLERGGALYALLFVTALLGLYAVVRLEERVLRLCGWVLRRLPVGSPQAREKVVQRLGDLITGLHVLFVPRTSLPVFGVCLVCWGLISGINYFSMLAVSPTPSLVASVILTFFTVLGILLVATPSGAGTVHGVTVLTLALFGIRAEEALAVGILLHALVTLCNVALGLVSAHMVGFRLGQMLVGETRKPD